MKRLFIDMDGTLARFHDEALYLERMYEDGFFKNLKPFENMVSGIKEFMKRHPDIDVYIVSSAIDSPFCEKDKNSWLDKYLPEISYENRLFPKVGTIKAEHIKQKTGIAVSQNDFLLDDYNKGLVEFENAGGVSIKCHNNINHKGLGNYGGQKGRLWIGDMVHTEDLPVMIASELSLHMELDMDFKSVFEEYGLENGNLNCIEIDNRQMFSFGGKSYFDNPLDAIRNNSNSHTNSYRRQYRPIVIKYKNDFRILPKFKYDAMKRNYFSSNKYLDQIENRSLFIDDMMLRDFKKYIFENTHHLKIADNIISGIVNARLDDKIKSANDFRQQYINDNRKEPER